MNLPTQSTFAATSLALLLTALSACATSNNAAAPQTSASEQAEGPPERLNDADVKAARMNAQVVAGTWLLEIDKGNYADSWDKTASNLQNTVTKGEWADGLGKARGPFGDMQRRHFLKTIYSNKLQPVGHHVVVNYHTQFANSAAKESVTVFRDADNEWRVIMYGVQKTDKAPPAEEAPTEPQPESSSDEGAATP